MQSEYQGSRHINKRFHSLRNNYNEADFFTKQLPTPLYEQARRDLNANESSSNQSSFEIETNTRLIRIEIKYLWTNNPKILQVKCQ
jgi:hypothetical protein